MSLKMIQPRCFQLTRLINILISPILSSDFLENDVTTFGGGWGWEGGGGWGVMDGISAVMAIIKPSWAFSIFLTSDCSVTDY